MSPFSRWSALALCLSLAACGSKDDAKAPSDDTEAVVDTDVPEGTDTPPDDTDVEPADTDPTAPVDTDPEEPTDTDPEEPTDTDATHTDTTPVDTDPPAPPTPYGPPNSWYHVDVADLPPGLRSTGVDVGDVAPNFTLIDQYGDQVELYQFYGQAIMLDIFAEWCGPCIEAAPYHEAFYAAHAAEGFTQLSIMQERSNFSPPRTAAHLQPWVNHFGITSPVLADPNYITDPLLGSGFPTFILINRDMTIAYVEEGFDGTLAFLESVTAPWIAEDVRVPEDCGDGIGNDADFRPDCADPDCAGDSGCQNEISLQGSISPCYTGDFLTGVVDTYLITSDVGVRVRADTVRRDTAFDIRVFHTEAPGVYSNNVVTVADDEVPCTYPPPGTFSCGDGWLGAGTWEIVVDSYLDCRDDNLGEYVLTVTGGPNLTITPVLDDAPDFHDR
jgi:thiol-disulfide isomerase/thioredoxin